MLKLPYVQYIWKINSGLKLLSETVAVIYWISFLTVCLIAMIRAAETCEKYRYAVMLFIGMWSFQAIPAAVPMRNYGVSQEIDRQISDVCSGKSDTVMIDNRRFDLEYMYFDAFSPAYAKDIRKYYSLPKKSVLRIIQ